uniref:Uncharacterized protein n=1 Tax=Arundo donax TaxID=35708 RepID=A0A0A9ACL7_ARUDO
MFSIKLGVCPSITIYSAIYIVFSLLFGSGM